VERNGEEDAKGYRLGEPMRALVAIFQLVPKTIWKTHLVPSGMPSWRARKRVFDAVLGWAGKGMLCLAGGFRTVIRSSALTSQHLVYSKLPGRYHSQRVTVSGEGEGEGKGQ
jgi:hypothetical protein